MDDHPGSLELLSSALAQPHLRIYTTEDPETGLELVYRHRPQIVLTDLVMPKLSGLEVLDRIVAFDPSIHVILMTAHYSTESAVDAIKRGAFDYLNKPVNLSALRERVGRIVEETQRRLRAAHLEDELLDSSAFEGMVGNSPVMWELYSKIRRIAPHFRTVLITGPTGTGKDLVAHALHKLSPAAKGNFVVLNCSAVVETLFESELFGHVKGAFTGASADKIGLFEYANHGVLFLDEIGDMPMSTQAKLLRALQNQEIQRVGSLTPRKVNVRVIAATNRDLRAAAAENRFREDLYYRLNMVEIRTPTLSERIGDLPLLIRHYVRMFSSQFGKSIVGLTPRAELVLARHNWPGNVRELENVIGHACMMATGDRIDVPDLPDSLRSAHPLGREASVAASAPGATPGVQELSPLNEQERRLLVEALSHANGNQSEAARLLQIGRDALRYKMKKFGIEVSPAG
ncbi:MAG: sigma-54-dependent Fis family transcriptional regulator [Acidobacteriaceae bacterium]|nr:sigma-54-dependent Fis family transcriptional regulator [Acidobacteriaceae bacterium]MBV9038014.1 sigma-54-dependent Fis family transcriptional regulator [Acidobacteriaceae bacterium]MBV9227349.1 sigma-54-dependent Fis family transcriptional regulator [Acidobacteriaceae bacterium]MBV9937273.1 sigma-54-dependent Fis family transcriptional regulator [Acidobacteriaceae bacterium]